ncbi:tryptophan--tRNA ligase [Membranihabitans maritimus]|uniref:tryptophan--tRNA ligase n=1 Tax=Membranihabitans maritimus TaxID=2904244 RepID=UPI001F0009A3|nr:tryptophan--tRNA ligase [Membranihabitans maritimus]
MESSSKQVLSLIQPTGDIHLGNYLGAVKNWVDIQEKYSSVLGVANLHAMTMPYKAPKLREATWKMAYQLLATGINHENLFIQSLIPEHMELCWILSSVCSYGDLTRMTQFKDKSDQIKEVNGKEELISSALFFYPVLQAADILIYKADYVPVGKDQEQHLELSRSIAQRFNYQFGVEYFKMPEPLFTNTPKILSTANPHKKMSKSLGDKHFINIFEDEKRIRKQINSAVTDTGENPDGEMSPGVSNLFQILKSSGNIEGHDALLNDFNSGSLKYKDLKQEVGNSLVSFLEPIRNKYLEIQGNKRKYRDMVKQSSIEIRKRAQKTLSEVREITGILNVKY